MSDLISVIIPVHNAEKTLKRCLDSAIEQTYYNIEIIIVNDSSSDNSLLICKEYMEKDNRIRYYDVNLKSAGLTRNFGLKKVKGKYVVFIDSDDYAEKNMIEKLYSTIIDNKTDAVFCNFFNINNGKREKCFKNIKSIKNYERNEIRDNVIYNSIYSFKLDGDFSIYALWHGIYNMKIIKENKIEILNENDILSEDCIFNFEYLCKTNRITMIEDSLYNYVINNESICHRYNTRYEKIDIWYNKIIEIAEENEISKTKLDKVLNERYVDFSINRIKQEILLSDKKILYRIQKIREIIKSVSLQKSIKKLDYKKRTKKNKILIKLIQCKMVIIIYMLIMLKDK